MMDEFELLYRLILGLEEVSGIVPEGTSKEFEIDGNLISIVNAPCSFSVQVEAEHEDVFDDSETKEIVAEFLKNIENLDGDIFNEALDAIRGEVNLNEFDRLTHLDSFTEDEANTVEELIDKFSDIIAAKLQSKIEELVSLQDRF